MPRNTQSAARATKTQTSSRTPTKSSKKTNASAAQSSFLALGPSAPNLPDEDYSSDENFSPDESELASDHESDVSDAEDEEGFSPQSQVKASAKKTEPKKKTVAHAAPSSFHVLGPMAANLPDEDDEEDDDFSPDEMDLDTDGESDIDDVLVEDEVIIPRDASGICGTQHVCHW